MVCVCWSLLLGECVCVGVFCCLSARVLLLCECTSVGVGCCVNACLLEFVV